MATSIQSSKFAHIGRRNISTLYAFTATSRLWFDGGLWVVYFQHQGISLFQIGLLEALLHIVAVVSDVPIGAFADRYGWKTSMALGTLLGVVYTSAALFATNIWWIALAFAARGLQVTMTNGSDAAILYESTFAAGIADKHRAISGRMFAISLISLGVAEAVGGTLAHISWSLIYVAFTLSNLVSFCVVLCLKEPRALRDAANQESASPSVVAILKAAFQFARNQPSFIKWLVLSGTLFGFVATFAFYGQALLLHGGWTLIGIGILMGIENGIGALAAAMADKVANRLGERAAMTSMGALASVGLLLFAWLPGIFAGIGYLLNSIGANVADPIINHGLNRIVPSEQRATLLSANSTAFSLFMILVFPLFGALAKYTGLSTAAHIVSVFAVLCVVMSIAWWLIEPRTAAVEEAAG